MDQRIRLLAAGAVMFAGLGVAMCFRRTGGEAAMTIPAQAEAIASHKAIVSPSIAASQLSPTPRLLPTARTETRALQTTTIVKPNDEPAPPPEFAKCYPANQVASSRWGTSMADMLPENVSSPPTHKIVDGDTLASLAERYLGSSSRAMEIYQANRDVLGEPGELPINTVLKIPRVNQSVSTR